jgi:hypothetical protein
MRTKDSSADLYPTSKGPFLKWANCVKENLELTLENMGNVLDEILDLIGEEGISMISAQSVFEPLYLVSEDIYRQQGGLCKIPYFRDRAKAFVAYMAEKDNALKKAWCAKQCIRSIDGTDSIRNRKNVVSHYLLTGRIWCPKPDMTESRPA